TFAAASPRHLRTSLTALMIVAIATNLMFPGVPRPPADWEAIDTNFGEMSPAGSSMLKQFDTAQFIQQRALASPDRVIVFPETVVPRWSNATDLFWQPTLSFLTAKGKILLVGAGTDIPGSEKYRNVVIIRGAESTSFNQRIPVPLGMWQPFGNGGVPLQIFSDRIVPIFDERVTVLICY